MTPPPSREKAASGLDAVEVQMLDRELTSVITEAAKRLEASGEDPLNPLTQTILGT
jgi:hypothetical protein